MKFSTSHTFFASLLVLLSANAFPLAIFAQRLGVNNNRAGASNRVNSSVNIQNRGNINRSNVNVNVNRPNNNWNNNNRSNVNVNVNRPNNNWNNNRSNVNVNVNRPNNNWNNNRPNVNVNVNNNNNWRGGGWYGGGYRNPPAWGLAGLATGLVIGAALRTPPPYFVPVAVGSNNFIYSEGVFLQPTGGQYIVVRPPIGAVVPSIPDGCDAIDNSGVVLYDCSGVIYQPFYQGSDLVFKVVRY
jgi:hypothetical protein